MLMRRGSASLLPSQPRGQQAAQPGPKGAGEHHSLVVIRLWPGATRVVRGGHSVSGCVSHGQRPRVVHRRVAPCAAIPAMLETPLSAHPSPTTTPTPPLLLAPSPQRRHSAALRGPAGAPAAPRAWRTRGHAWFPPPCPRRREPPAGNASEPAGCGGGWRPARACRRWQCGAPTLHGQRAFREGSLCGCCRMLDAYGRVPQAFNST